MKKLQLEKITSDQFLDRVVAKEADALIKIGNEWSGADQMLCHTCQELATQYASRLHFFSVDFREDSYINIYYRIETVPTLLFFKKGTLVDKISGLANRNVIANKINQLINS
jgi:thioredoxin 1